MALGLVAAGAGPGQAREVSVSAAVSLSDVLHQLAAVYEQRSGERVALNLGPSNTLARQILAGAKVDVFISADEAQLDVISTRIAGGSRVDLLGNQLAVAVPDDRPRRLTSATDLADAAIRRIAIGDPAGVPAGVYAKAYLQKLGIWNSIAHKVIPSGSVRLALAAVENGAADAAIVYRTDIATARRARVALVVPLDEGPRIVYPAAIIRGGANPAGAARFMTFIRSVDAAQLFERAGFIPLGRPVAP